MGVEPTTLTTKRVNNAHHCRGQDCRHENCWTQSSFKTFQKFDYISHRPRHLATRHLFKVSFTQSALLWFRPQCVGRMGCWRIQSEDSRKSTKGTNTKEEAREWHRNRLEDERMHQDGREPWSSGYGRQLMFKRSWVQITALYTGWTWYFSNWFVVKIVLFVWKDRN